LAQDAGHSVMPPLPLDAGIPLLVPDELPVPPEPPVSSQRPLRAQSVPRSPHPALANPTMIVTAPRVAAAQRLRSIVVPRLVEEVRISTDMFRTCRWPGGPLCLPRPSA